MMGAAMLKRHRFVWSLWASDSFPFGTGNQWPKCGFQWSSAKWLLSHGNGTLGHRTLGHAPILPIAIVAKYNEMK